MKPELLAPVGSFPALYAAIESGADAIYLGLKEFNMRNSARNFTISELKKIRRILNERAGRKIKIYLTLNTIVYDSEIKQIEKILKQIKPFIDAVICWDLSVIELCKKYKIPFHLSTQASVANSESALFYKKLGAKRIVLARELSLQQIKKISKIIDTEIFIHGAMCVSVSGRCFTSQFLFNKSANRGECIHPCRRKYIVKDEEGRTLKLEHNTVMSAKDLCTLPFIEKLKSAGIKAFKIEGRNRNPEYVKTVTSVYRHALDKKLSAPELKKSLKELEKVYNKGFSSGFFLGVPTSDDFSDVEDSKARERKIVIGKVEKYWPKVKVAAIKIFTRSIKIGDDIYIIGKNTGVQRINVQSMEINHKSVSQAEKGQSVGIKLPKRVQKSDGVYLIKKSNSSFL